MTSTLTDVAFIDIETTGLNPQIHEIWEIGIIKVNYGKPAAAGASIDKWFKWQLQVQVEHLVLAESKALEINKFHERFNAEEAISPQRAARVLMDILEGCTLVGANPHFDATFCTNLLEEFELLPTWHHHLVDVEALAAGYLIGKGFVSPEKWSLNNFLQALEITTPVDHPERHSALFDAELAMKVFERVVLT